MSRSRIIAQIGGMSLALALLSACVWPLAAKAEATWTVASEWTKASGSSIRLIGAELKDAEGKGRLVAGIEIALDDGWKTYWRSPGDSGGIPPTFDWDQSANIAKAELLYPAPARYEDPEGLSAGYKHHVVFPIEVTAEGSNTPELKLGAFYGICREICVPSEAELALTLAPAASANPQIVAALESALAAVPRDLPEGALPAVTSIGVSKVSDGGTLAVEAKFDPAATQRALFVEVVDGSYLPIPGAPMDGGEGRTRFEVKLKAREVADIAGKTLILTLVSDKGNAEIRRKPE